MGRGWFGAALTSLMFLAGVAHADWPRELFKKSYDQLNGRQLKGRYFITGAAPQTGTFNADLKMPNTVQWNMVDSKTKQEQSFRWSKSEGVLTVSNGKPSHDPLLNLLDSTLGKLAVTSLIGSLHEWRDANSMSSKLVTMTSRFDKRQHYLALKPNVPLLEDYTWTWVVVTEPQVKVLEWKIQDKLTEYLFEFERKPK